MQADWNGSVWRLDDAESAFKTWIGGVRAFAARLLSNILRRPEPEDFRGVTQASPWGALVTIANVLVYYVNGLGAPYANVLGVWCICSIWISLVVFQRTMSVRDHLMAHVSRRAIIRVVIFTFTMSIPWVSLAVIIGLEGSEQDQILALILLMGMAAGGILMLHRVMFSALIYCGTIMTVACVSILVSVGAAAWPMVFYVVMFGSMLFFSAHVVGETARERDLSMRALSEATEEIQRMAMEDGLTGLLNRAALIDSLERLTGEEGGGRPFATFMLDLDRFKNVNDSFGHPVGDDLLRVIARRLRHEVRSDDQVARLGGDEFAVVITGVNESEIAQAWAARLLNAINEPAEVRGQVIHPGASIGCSFFPDHATTAPGLLLTADIGLNAAKARGRANCVLFSPDLARVVDEEEQIAADLRIALARDDLRVHYQPKVCLSDGRVIGAEALVRWQHPIMGDLPPDRFLEVSAERGLMPEVGTYIVEAVGRDIARWKEIGLAFGSVAVNVHPVDLKTPHMLVERLARLGDVGVEKSDVVLEITEGCFAGRGTDHAAMLIDMLRDTGFQLSLDDFGTGHASLSHLRNLPVQEVKIDRSFVEGLDQSRHDLAIVSAIVALGQGLGLRIVAEGIENEAQLARLVEIGVTVGQGFLWAPALPAEAFEELVIGWDAKARRRGEISH